MGKQRVLREEQLEKIYDSIKSHLNSCKRCDKSAWNAPSRKNCDKCKHIVAILEESGYLLGKTYYED